MKKRRDGFQGERSIVLPPSVVEMEASDPLVSSLYVTDMGYYPAAQYHYRERSAAIPQHVLIYCVSGSGWYRVDGRTREVKANQYFILPAGKSHVYGTYDVNPWTIYWLHFEGDHASIYAQGAAEPQTVRPGIHSRISQRNNIFEEMFFTLSGDQSRESLRYVSSLLHYYLASMRYLHSYREAENYRHRDEEQSMAEAAVHFLHENIERRLTVAEIASYLGYSESYFSTLFRRATGQSPINYFNRLKVEKAREMLRSTDIHINQLCFKVGIQDPYYFSRLFRRLTGISPQGYREKNGE